MKHSIWYRIFCCLVLLAALLSVGAACAEEEIAEVIELDLFIDGKFPESQIIRTYATDGLYDYLHEELSKLNPNISLKGYDITSAEAKAFLSDVVNSSPELFYVSTTFTIYKSKTTGYATRTEPQYRFSAEELPERIARFNAQAKEIADFAAPASTDLGKLLRVNDYFCANFVYDGSDPHYRPDQLFDTGRGVCQSYMLGYAAVLDVLGIENTHATSDAMNHTWSMVYLDDEWYHVDVTWNDPVEDMPLRACHTNFLLSDAGITETGHHDWVSSEIALSTKYDSFFWKDIFTPLACTGSSVYYLDPAIANGMRTINCWNMDLNTTSAVHEFSIVDSSGFYTYYDNYRPIATDGVRLFYTACGNLYSILRNGSQPALVYTTGDESIRIFSLYIQDNTVSMLVGEDINAAQLQTCTIEEMMLQLDRNLVRLQPEESTHLSAFFNTDPETAVAVSWFSSNPDVADVNEAGLVCAGVNGTAELRAVYADGVQVNCIIVVHEGEILTLPASLAEIHDSAFLNSTASEIILPDGVETISNSAFAGSSALLINIPDSVSFISETAFMDCPNLTLLLNDGSPWLEYAAAQGIPCLIMK